MQPVRGSCTSRISSMSAPECSTAGRRTYSASQLDHEERDAVERSRVDSCNSSPRHGGGEGVGGRRGGTDAGVAKAATRWCGDGEGDGRSGGEKGGGDEDRDEGEGQGDKGRGGKERGGEGRRR